MRLLLFTTRVLYILSFSTPLYPQDVAIRSLIRASVRGGDVSRTRRRTTQRGYGSGAVPHVPGGTVRTEKGTTHTLLPHRCRVSIADLQITQDRERLKRGEETTTRWMFGRIFLGDRFVPCVTGREARLWQREPSTQT